MCLLFSVLRNVYTYVCTHALSKHTIASDTLQATVHYMYMCSVDNMTSMCFVGFMNSHSLSIFIPQ